ncbi:uncharacterized protein LOC110017869 [Phalaenopsis equestris]|uniref:uncharacterized protein LOC110017869 n=1 Tax=Phalaenopsis equestris TaxID=78828 RepID=UPI0009E25F16|nr:uncharacterized protein LOC110017869 [Phalaenopsis equestris]
MPPAAAASTHRKTRRQIWLPSCLFDSCACDPDDSPAKPAERVRRQNKATPLTEEISEDREGFMAEGGGMKKKIEKRCKPLPACSNKRCNNHLPFINYQPAATNRKVNRRGPVQSSTSTKTIHSGWSEPTQPTDSTQSYPKKMDLLVGLKMITMLLVTILIGGKLFAVFITTICFYVFSCVDLSRSPMFIVPTQKSPRR